MAICPFCKEYISATICQKYNMHIGMCKQLYDAKQKLKFNGIEPDNEPIKIKVNRFNGLESNNKPVKTKVNLKFQLNSVPYPKSVSSECTLTEACVFNVDAFDTVEKINNHMQSILQYHNCELMTHLNGHDQLAKNQTYSFLIDVLKIFKTRLIKETHNKNNVIEIVEQYMSFCHGQII
jgi:hypothetical protein